MGERALQNRIIKLQELEAQQKALEQEANELKEEIKKEMEARGAEELEAGNFIIRWKTIIGNRFDIKAFQKEHKALYSQYTKQTGVWGHPGSMPGNHIVSGSPAPFREEQEKENCKS